VPSEASARGGIKPEQASGNNGAPYCFDPCVARRRLRVTRADQRSEVVQFAFCNAYIDISRPIGILVILCVSW